MPKKNIFEMKTEGNANNQNTAKNENVVNLMKPQAIKEYLDQYVIGQDEAKKILSVAVYNHYKRLINKFDGVNSTEIGKSNVILLGNTGCGKTYMVRLIAKLLDVPCYVQDSTKMTQSGYVGSDCEDCLCGLLRMCNYDLGLAQMGIVVLDECDKIGKMDVGQSLTRDVSGEGVQQSLLKIVEGDFVGVPPAGGRKHPEQKLIYVDTTNILFIASGAFVGIEDIIRKRLGGKSIGFDRDRESTVDTSKGASLARYTTPQDLKDFGFIPEFVGRFPVIANVEPLTVDNLIEILSKPKNSIIKQYTDLMALDGIKITFTEDAYREIAKLAYNLETGARGLRAIVETVMTDIMYYAPSGDEKEIVVDGETVIKNTSMKYGKLKAA